MEAMAYVYQLSGVRYAPPGAGEVLAGVELVVATGELVWVSGPSGGGKSTLLRLMNRLLDPAAGSIRFQNRGLAEWPPTELRRRAALLPQSPVMVAGDVRANLLLPFSLKAAAGAAPPGDDELARRLAGVGLDGVGLDQPARELSVGQQQRVSLLRVLMMEPAALLLDEPVAALDDDSRRQVEGKARDFAARGGAVVMVSHQSPNGGDGVRALRLAGGVLQEA